MCGAKPAVLPKNTHPIIQLQQAVVQFKLCIGTFFTLFLYGKSKFSGAESVPGRFDGFCRKGVVGCCMAAVYIKKGSMTNKQIRFVKKI